MSLDSEVECEGEVGEKLFIPPSITGHTLIFQMHIRESLKRKVWTASSRKVRMPPSAMLSACFAHFLTSYAHSTIICHPGTDTEEADELKCGK